MKGLTQFNDFNYPPTLLQSTGVVIPLFHFDNESRNKAFSRLKNKYKRFTFNYR